MRIACALHRATLHPFGECCPRLLEQGRTARRQGEPRRNGVGAWATTLADREMARVGRDRSFAYGIEAVDEPAAYVVAGDRGDVDDAGAPSAEVLEPFFSDRDKPADGTGQTLGH